MTLNPSAPIVMDLDRFKLHLSLPGFEPMTLHFDTPSRRFYLSLMALVAEEMKREDERAFVPLADHGSVLALLNETVAKGAGSSQETHLLRRIYNKWKAALPDLENAPLFKVMGRKKAYEDESGRVYRFDEKLKDLWANLFEYRGSRNGIRLRLAVEKLGLAAEDVTVVFDNQPDTAEDTAWERFLNSLKSKGTLTGEKIPDGAATPGTVGGKVEGFSVPRASAERLRRALPALLILMAAVSLVLILTSILKPENAHIVTDQIAPAPKKEKPSIAVLPFSNLSADPQQVYLCDGITEQIITALAKTPKMRVIARNSSFTYREKPTKIQDVARDLGVRYVLEGSVQKSGDRLRVTAQLIDAEAGHHLWADSYERDLKNLFSLQDDITKNIITALQVELTDGETARIYGGGTENVDAFLKVAKGRHHVLRLTRHDNLIARKLYEEAIRLDSEYARAYTALGWTYWHDAFQGWTDEPAKAYEKAVELGKKAHSLDAADSGPLMLMAWVYATTLHPNEALEAATKGISLDPHVSEACWCYGGTFEFLGRYKEAIPWIEKGVRLDPIPPWWAMYHLAFCYFCLADNEKALDVLNRAMVQRPRVGYFHTLKSFTLLQDGKPHEALPAIEQAMSLLPQAPTWVTATRAVALHATGNSEEALPLMEDLVRRHPDDPDALRHFGRFLGLLGRHQEGALTAEKAVRLRPGPQTHLFLGRQYVVAGQYERAIVELEEAAKLLPDHLQCHIWLAASWSLSGDTKKARAEIAEVHRLNPDYSLECFSRNSYNAYPSGDRNRIMDALEIAGLK